MPGLSKLNAHIAHSTNAERQGTLHQRAGPLLCAAPAVHSPPKRGKREKGVAKTAKSKNGHAGWNPGTARPVRYGANQSALHQGAAV